MAYASSSSSRNAPLYAALDLGTNNCRMLVARPQGRGFKVVDAFSRVTRLGEGLSASGVLSEAAMARTLDALEACVEKLERNQVGRARMVATEACRRAANGTEFTTRITERTGLKPDIISPREEASLALGGCASLLDPHVPWALVFDIGGGSTELVWVQNSLLGQQVMGVQSIPTGVVTLAEQWAQELASNSGYARVVERIGAAFRPFEAMHTIGAMMAGNMVQMLGTSGTVTTLGALHLGLERYDRSRVDGLELGFADIAAVTRRLAAMTHEQRAAHPCIGEERADLVVAGCAILEAVCRLWPLGKLRVADRGVREGVLLSMMREDGTLGARN
ncbi:Phosphatase Ppx/GppA family [Paramagnetospirillum magnetotacticum MS-1]|uniref:Phosphatase Ppx/GppA family n=1 Tax=Paramagnetospirillum magnetotacticum MS-1 TaxID=272627 RepID=A0A0C2UWI6_PARME|nr:Ppx/GppA phosphatase family protein [Paramagnetospirillum magnetotacticum]KIL97166.1 Phosphatase Ppx/GppA family [Paramagnetospirillum magnetotacticum MS-1]